MHQHAEHSGSGVELAPLPSKQSDAGQTQVQAISNTGGEALATNGSAEGSLREEHQSPAHPAHGLLVVDELPPQQDWNKPRINAWRVIFSCYGLVIMGLHDGSVGALLPYVEKYYDLSYVVVSMLFITPVFGFLVSMVTLNLIHERFGQRGVAIIGAFFRLAAYLIISLHPPFPVVALAYALTGFGNGIIDAAWNAWIGNLRNANEVMGFLHAAYGLGGILGPLIATAMVARYDLPWYMFGYVMVGLLVIDQLTTPVVFWTADARAFREAHPNTTAASTASTGPDKKSALLASLRRRATWVVAAFMLLYVGLEVSLAGWMNTFLQVVRAAPPFEAGLSTTVFWTGATVGRLALGFVTGHIGEKLAGFIYLGLAIACHLVFYLVPSVPISLAAIGVEGFWLGPIFPGGVVALTKLLPPHLHVSGVGIVVIMGATGACLLPFAVGALAQARGVQVLIPTVLAFLVADILVWALLPPLKQRKRE